MDKSELKDYAEKSLVDGYSKDELRDLLIEEGHEEGKVDHVLDEIDDKKFGRSIETSLKALELDDKTFTVDKSFLGRELEVKNQSGETVLYKPEEIPEEKAFKLRSGEREALEVIESEEGLYEMFDPEAERAFLKLEKGLEGPKSVWEIRTADGEHAASMKPGNTASNLLRRSSSIFSFIPHRYVIETAEGEEIGEVFGEKSREDEYTIEIDEEGGLSREAVVTAAITVDFLETGQIRSLNINLR